MFAIARALLATTLVATATVAVASTTAPSATAGREWVERSNANAAPLLQLIARYAPESAAALGVDGFDADVLDLKAGIDERFRVDAARVIADYQARLAVEQDPRVRQDLQLLIDSTQREQDSADLQRRLMLPHFDLAKRLFHGFNSLLDPRVARERYPAALVRLAKYTGREPGYEPIATLARARSAERFGDAALTGPWSVEVEQDLANQARYMQGIRELFQKSGLEGWEDDLKLLESQLDDYAQWVRAEILPRARTTNRLPPEIYANNLTDFGVQADPRALIDQATLSFVQTREEMQALATLVAKERKLQSSDYRDVLKYLKQQTIANDALIPTYHARLAALEDLIRTQRIVTLPERAAVIRLGTAAESAAQPAPHIKPPRLIGNTGEPAEFVLPLENPNARPGTKMDDFTFDAITWTLTAHEARPGHELQFSKMMENGVSIPRAVFAFNSANVEGWALYAEALVKQHLPLEGQMGTLQMRMMREARAFLDPMVNLGLIEPAAVQAFLMKEIGLSEPMAKQEVDRYTFRMPGQATSYFYGYQRHLALRGKVELALGDQFDAHAYHDFVLDQGLLPPELLEQAVMERYVAPRLQAKVAK
jgi:hypothetical protein